MDPAPLPVMTRTSQIESPQVPRPSPPRTCSFLRVLRVGCESPPPGSRVVLKSSLFPHPRWVPDSSLDSIPSCSLSLGPWDHILSFLDHSEVSRLTSFLHTVPSSSFLVRQELRVVLAPLKERASSSLCRPAPVCVDTRRHTQTSHTRPPAFSLNSLMCAGCFFCTKALLGKCTYFVFPAACKGVSTVQISAPFQPPFGTPPSPPPCCICLAPSSCSLYYASFSESTSAILRKID